MNIFELQDKMQKQETMHRANSDAIIAFVRPLVSALRDLGREHTAKELEQLLFILDAHTQETAEWMKTNAPQIFEMISESFRRGGPPR